MNTKRIDGIANAVLYEGYMLYPYRSSSVKNRQRFNFGVLYPQAYSEAQTGSDSWSMQAECLVQTGSLTSMEVKVRFLKLVARSTWKLAETSRQSEQNPVYEAVPTLEVDGKVFGPWQEAIECEVALPACCLDALTAAPLEWEFAFPARDERELLHDASGRLVGLLARTQEQVSGVVRCTATRAVDGICKLQVRVNNLTSFETAPDTEDNARQSARESGLMRSLVSAHILLGVIDGQFVSLLEPPENLSELAASCQNICAWPVLVGDQGQYDTMLASPIILYDYPQIAPESPGDLFDGTEIDEILALRIMTMTDEEKKEMRNIDVRARKILERTESLPMERLMKLHGTLRELPTELRSWKEDVS
jgi:hydrogenase maturation protease